MNWPYPMSDECTAYSEGFSYSAHIHSSEVCFVTLAAFSQLSPPDVRTVWVRCWVSLSIAGVNLFQRRVRVAESEGAHISSLQTIWALVWHYWIKRKLIMSQVKCSVCPPSPKCLFNQIFITCDLVFRRLFVK